MITHILRLAVGEWYKLRRRWIPWILLGIFIFVTQAILLIDYTSLDAGDPSAFGLPSNIAQATTGPTFLILLMMILAASVIGAEYGLGTLRVTLARGVGRWQLLSAKLIMLMAVALAGIIVIGVLVGIATLLMGIIAPAEEVRLIVADTGAWIDTVLGAGKAVYAVAPYIALAAFLAVVTQSTAQGIALSLGYYILEQILPSILAATSDWDWMWDVLDVALLRFNIAEWTSAGPTADTFRAFFVILAYTALLVAISMWVFLRRDVPGAKGE